MALQSTKLSAKQTLASVNTRSHLLGMTMNLYEEFVHSEDEVEATPEYQIIEFDNRRTHQRFSLRRNKRAPLAFACDGLTVNLSTTRWFVITPIGTANIKDISIGGVGILCNEPLSVGRRFYIELEQTRVLCEVTREHTIKGRLKFLGARWIYRDKAEVQNLIDAIRLRAKI